MPMKHLVLAACCTLLSLAAWGQFLRSPFPRVKPPAGIECPLRPAECVINVQAFDFGRGQMNQNASPINGTNTISVTCTRAPLDGLNVLVQYDLQAIPPTPARQMRDNELRFLAYDMFVDPARTRYWGYEAGHPSTSSFQGELQLDDRNRVGTLAHVVYGRVHGGQAFAPSGQWLGLVGVRLQYYAICLS